MDQLIDDQLGGLFYLEVKYSPRDYLLDDVAAKHFCCDRSDNNHSYCTTTTSTTTTSNTSDRETRSATAIATATSTDDHNISIEEGNENNNNTHTIMNNHKTLITKQKVVDWRSKICEWFYHVVDHFDLRRDLALIALNYVDRYCAASSEGTSTTVNKEVLRDKNQYKLLAMTSLCLVLKLHGDLDDSTSITIPSGVTVESWTIDIILQLGRDNYTATQLKSMEINVLQHLQWLLHPPTPQVFISCFFELFPYGKEMIVELQEMTSYIVELSIHDYYFVSFKPSVIALASLCNATEMLLGPSSVSSSSFSTAAMMMMMTMTHEHSSWLTNLQEHLFQNYGYEETNTINACRGRLMELYVNTGTKLEDFIDPSHENNNDHFLDDDDEQQHQQSIHNGESSPMSVIH